MLETGRQHMCHTSAVSINYEEGITIARTKATVLGLNQSARIAREVAAHEDADLVAVAGFGDAAEQVASEIDGHCTPISKTCSARPHSTRTGQSSSKSKPRQTTHRERKPS